MDKIIMTDKSDKFESLHSWLKIYGVGQMVGWGNLLLGGVSERGMFTGVGLFLVLICSLGWTIVMWRLAKRKNRSAISWVLGINLINFFGIAQLIATFIMINAKPVPLKEKREMSLFLAFFYSIVLILCVITLFYLWNSGNQ